MMSLLQASLSPTVRTALKRSVKNHACRSMTILSKESAEEYKKLNYTSRMKQTGRPMSPHVTIYAFPPVALSSITNRVTGIAMAGAFAGLSTVELLLGSGSALELTQAIGSSSSVLVQSAAKFGVAFPITYHYLGALRHFAWDAKPDLLTNSDVEKSSYQLLGAATVVAGALMFI